MNESFKERIESNYSNECFLRHFYNMVKVANQKNTEKKEKIATVLQLVVDISPSIPDTCVTHFILNIC